MSFDAHLAEHRFGYGLSPRQPPPPDLATMLSRVAQAEPVESRFPLPPFHRIQTALVEQRRFRRYARAQSGTPEAESALQRVQQIVRALSEEHARWFGHTLLRRIQGQAAFRERLIAFWADHFTAFGGNAFLRSAPPLYAEAAIRPHIAGSFADLLTAAVTHPLMLQYLDQVASVGPNSPRAKRRARGQGLNENLAREVLELHTLGVGATYRQQDVRALAELLTGLSLDRRYGFKYRPALSEPGPKTVLGTIYDGDEGLDAIHEVLRDLARHPGTARHIARKLVVHFIADRPPDDVVSAVEAAFLSTDGDLMACYRALLTQKAAWEAPARNFRPPLEYMSAALRALDPPEEALRNLDLRRARRLFFRPLRLMGQPWMLPAGPDGFAEADSAWITPQGIATRLEWAMNVPARLMTALPDPQVLLQNALGERPPPATAFAARAAENRREAVGLILSSPAFQRR